MMRRSKTRWDNEHLSRTWQAYTVPLANMKKQLNIKTRHSKSALKYKTGKGRLHHTTTSVAYTMLLANIMTQYIFRRKLLKSEKK